MRRIFLRLLNAPGLVVLAAIGVALQTSLFAWKPASYFQPDFVLIFIMWCALKRNFFEGGVLTLIIADIAEIHSSAPQGLFLITYMIVFLAVRLAAKVLVIPGLSSWITLTLSLSVVSRLVGLSVLLALGASLNQWRQTVLTLFPGAVMAGLCGSFMYRWLDKYDAVTFKHVREQVLETDLQVENAG